MRRPAIALLAIGGLALIAWSLWIRLQLRAVDGGGAARLRRVGAALTGKDADIRRWHDTAVRCAVAGPGLVLLAIAWWRLVPPREPSKPRRREAGAD